MEGDAIGFRAARWGLRVALIATGKVASVPGISGLAHVGTVCNDALSLTLHTVPDLSYTTFMIP